MPATSADAGEVGGAVAVEMALVWGALLLVIAAVIQVGLLFYGGQIALTAAEDGLRSGRYLEGPSAERAQRDAQAYLDQAAGTVLDSPVVTARLDPASGLLRVEVTATVLSLVPGVDMRVERVAVGVVERITP